MMLVVYVAGPFSAKDRAGVQRNIANAEAVGLEVAKMGAIPLIPHANTSHPNFEAIQPYEWWIAATLELLRRCDALVTVPGWERSSGARGEVLEAATMSIPVFHELAALEKWLLSGRDDRVTLPAPAPGDDESVRLVGMARGEIDAG
jgi:hypothetical protein